MNKFNIFDSITKEVILSTNDEVTYEATINTLYQSGRKFFNYVYELDDKDIILDLFLTKYFKGGATAVYDLSNLLDIELWIWCDACEEETPHLFGGCLVCFSNK